MCDLRPMGRSRGWSQASVPLLRGFLGLRAGSGSVRSRLPWSHPLRGCNRLQWRPTECCPNCELDTLVRDVYTAAHREQPVHFCFTCGEMFEALDYCSSCSNPIVPNDGGLLVCETCFSHALDRN